MQIADFVSMCNIRVQNMAVILNIPDPPRHTGDIINFIKYQRSFLEVALAPHLSVFDVFDETNKAIGEDWIWCNSNFYFSRESDATWFILRWQE